MKDYTQIPSLLDIDLTWGAELTPYVFQDSISRPIEHADVFVLGIAETSRLVAHLIASLIVTKKAPHIQVHGLLSIIVPIPFYASELQTREASSQVP